MGLKECKITDADFKGKNIQSIDSDIVIGKAEELKRLFDAPAQEVVAVKLNALIDYLQSVSAGSEIGTPEISEGSGKTVAEQLSYLLREMQGISAGSIADGSLEDVKLSNEEGQIKDQVSFLREFVRTVEYKAPNNSVISIHCGINENDEDEIYLDYIDSERGALYVPSDDDSQKGRFGTLPMDCGGTNNKGLADAPAGAVIVKRTNTTSGNYLGYTTLLPVENGGTGASTPAAARSKLGAAAADHTHNKAIDNAPAGAVIIKKETASNGDNLGYTTLLPVENGGTGASTPAAARTKLGAAAADHTHDNQTVGFSVNSENFSSCSGMIRYNPVTNTCFARIYCKAGKSLTAGENYEVCTVGANFMPGNTHALSHYGSKEAVVSIGTDGKIEIRPRENISSGYDNYISGFWFV